MRRSSLVLVGLSIAVTACSGPGQEFLGPWLRPNGEPAGDNYRADDGFTMVSYRGSEHCNWESVVFLEIAWPPGSVIHDPNALGSARVFVRDPQEAYDFDRGGFSSDAVLPADAKTAAFTRDGWELWTSVEDDQYVFLVDEDRVERWPEGDRPGCD